MKARSAKIAGMAPTSKRRRASSSKQSSAGKERVLSVRRKDTLPRTGSTSPSRHEPVVAPQLDAPIESLGRVGAGASKKPRRLQQTNTAGTRPKAPRAAGRTSDKLKLSGRNVMRVAAAVVPEPSTPVAAKRPVGVEASAVIAHVVEPETVTAPEPVAEAVAAPKPATTADEESTMDVSAAPAGEALAAVGTEIVVEESAILEEASIVDGQVALPDEVASVPPAQIGQAPVSEDARGPAPPLTTVGNIALSAPAPHRRKRALVAAASRLLSTLSRLTAVWR